MNDRRRRLEIGLLCLFTGLACGYATRYLRLPLVDVAADLRPRLTRHPLLPNAAAIGTPVSTPGPLTIRTRKEAESPNEIILDVDSFDRIIGVTLRYTHPDHSFDIKSEALKRWGRFEKAFSMDMPDMGAFQDDKRGLVWTVFSEVNEESEFPPVRLSVHPIGFSLQPPLNPRFAPSDEAEQ